MDRTLVEVYRAGADVPGQCLGGLSSHELDAHPVAGMWSIREVILHLMDSDLVGADRMKRVIAEQNPTLLAYDESAFARNLGYGRLDAGLASEIFRLNRLMMATILEQLPDEAFARAGMHTEHGRESLEDLVRGYATHLDHHVRFIHAKRACLGRVPVRGE